MDPKPKKKKTNYRSQSVSAKTVFQEKLEQKRQKLIQGSNKVPISVLKKIEAEMPALSREDLQNQLEVSGTNDERKPSIITSIVNRRLEKNFLPYGYGDGMKRFSKAVFLNKKSDKDYDEQASTQSFPKRMDAFRMYLGRPQINNTFDISDYKPSSTKDNNNPIYYKINTPDVEDFMLGSYFDYEDGWKDILQITEASLPESRKQKENAIKTLKEVGGKDKRVEGIIQFYDEIIKKDEKVIKDILATPTEKRKQRKYDFSKTGRIGVKSDREELDAASPGIMGQYTMDRGKDERGEYISYYDKWDLKGSVGVGKPLEIYDRIYFDPSTGKVKEKNMNKKNFGGFLQSVSPLLGLIPGAGQVLSPLANIAGGLMNQQGQQQNMQNPMMPMQQNTNPYGYANGGQLQGIGPNTLQVEGNNPQQTDGVELQNAYVDHGETISNVQGQQYVFSDTLFNPLTGKTFAEDDKKLAKSDKKATEKGDVESRNTIKINQITRQNYMKLNEAVRIQKETNGQSDYSNYNHNSKSKSSDKLYEKQYGGKISMQGGGRYLTGYSSPWDNFDLPGFQKYAGLKEDNIYGPKTHEALTGDLGRQYALGQGYLWDNTNKGYLNASGISPGNAGIPTVDMLTSLTNNKFKNYDLAGNLKQINSDLAAIPGATATDNTLVNRDTPFNLGNPAASVVNNQGGIDTGGMGRGGQSTNTQANPFNIGTALQLAETLGKGATLLRKPEKQKLYQNNAPIGLRQYDPSSALLQNQYGFNALRNTINNSVGNGSRLSNLQQAYANKYSANAQVTGQYANMNKQAQDRYEAALGQRQSENNQARYLTDDTNARNQGAYFNALRGFGTDVGNWGRTINDQKSNKQATQWLLQAFPDIAKYFKLGG